MDDLTIFLDRQQGTDQVDAIELGLLVSQERFIDASLNSRRLSGIAIDVDLVIPCTERLIRDMPKRSFVYDRCRDLLQADRPLLMGREIQALLQIRQAIAF